MRLGRLCVLVWIGLSVTPGSALAATITLAPDLLVYRAAPGEGNVVTLRVEATDDGPLWTVGDAGAVIVAPAPCVPVDAHTVRCPPGPNVSIYRADVDVGDLDDRVDWAGRDRDEVLGEIVAKGGAGDDVLGGEMSGNTLFGGTGNDRLTGSRGDDRLDGGGGRDALYGRGGDDVMTDGDQDGAAGPGPDLLVGGGGVDLVSYRGRTAPVVVDLADREPDGENGEGDVLRGVENVEGGSGDDRLLGDERPNQLIGRPGRDRLSGRGGDDALRPGPGGGRVFCGAGGGDTVGPTGTDDRLARSCEIVDASHARLYSVPALPVADGPGRLTFTGMCPEASADAPALYKRCHGALHIREAFGARRLLGLGTYPAGEWYAHDFSVLLTPLGRRLTARPGGVLTTMRLGVRFREEGERVTSTARWTIPLALGR